MTDNGQLLTKVAEVYDWLDLQVRNHSDLAGVCDACGKCCDFKTPSSASEKPMPASRCPYNIGGKCRIYKYRFAGCRIFCCRADADFQSRLSESALKKFKSICTEFQIPYRYNDLPTALNGFAD
ncbi:MAG: hypothetical protein ACYTEO_16230 [Planctomycetota bacterium]|jgi:hypothetical protein